MHASDDQRSAPDAAVPAVTVVIPTYQRRDLVATAVATVLEQEFAPFEVVVVDDGSTDGTAEALADLVDEGRIRLLRQPNSGASAARNAGVRAARAAVVAFLDSDDRWLPHHLRVVTDTLERHPEAVLASTCPHFELYGREEPDAARLVDPLPSLLIGSPAGHLGCMAIRRGALDAVGGFDERLRMNEDTDLWARLALVGPFVVVRRRTFIYRRGGRDSKRERGQRSGESLDALELSTRGVLGAIERSVRPDVKALADRARGMLELIAGLRAIHARDEAGARRAFEAAAGLFPDLSESAAGGQFRDHLHRTLPDGLDPRRRLEYVSAALRTWPAPRSVTALALRQSAIGLALRVGRPGTAARLLAGWPRRSVARMPGLALGQLVYFTRSARRRARPPG